MQMSGRRKVEFRNIGNNIMNIQHEEIDPFLTANSATIPASRQQVYRTADKGAAAAYSQLNYSPNLSN